MATSVLIYALILTSFIFTVLGVECFVCQSRHLPECGDLFLVSPADQAYKARCPTSCFKFTAGIDEQLVISRGCLPEIKTPQRCQYNVSNNIYGIMCTCNSDFCNVTSGLQPERDWLLMMASFVVFWWSV